MYKTVYPFHFSLKLTDLFTLENFIFWECRFFCFSISNQPTTEKKFFKMKFLNYANTGFNDLTGNQM